MILYYSLTYRETQIDKVPRIKELGKVDILLLAAVIKSLSAEELKTTVSLNDNISLPLSLFYELDEKILQHLCRLNLLVLVSQQDQENVAIS